mgnify:CR=1 FL=1
MTKYLTPRHFNINIKIIIRDFFYKKLIIFQINLYIKFEMARTDSSIEHIDIFLGSLELTVMQKVLLL